MEPEDRYLKFNIAEVIEETHKELEPSQPLACYLSSLCWFTAGPGFHTWPLRGLLHLLDILRTFSSSPKPDEEGGSHSSDLSWLHFPQV